MQRNRVSWLFFEPLFEDAHGLADLPQRTMRKGQQLSRFLVLWLQRDYLAVARCRFLSSLQPIEQDAKVRVRVNVLWIQSNGCAIRCFCFRRFPDRP